MDKILNYKSQTIIKYFEKLIYWDNNFVHTGLLLSGLNFSTIISSLWDYPFRNRILVVSKITMYLSPVGTKLNCSDNLNIL
jgi:hypothetical protein